MGPRKTGMFYIMCVRPNKINNVFLVLLYGHFGANNTFILLSAYLWETRFYILVAWSIFERWLDKKIL